MIIKYCGISSKEDLDLIKSSQATHLGFIFAESKRKVASEQVASWRKQVVFDQKVVGVFVNEPLQRLQETIKEVNLDVIQFHGEESVEDLHYTRENNRVEIWKALSHSENTIQLMEKYSGVCDVFLIDQRVKNQRGGTGHSFDWTYVPHYINQAKQLKKKLIIAGGISHQNVNELLDFEIDGFDVASGIETAGRKDKLKINLLEERLRNGTNDTNA